MRELTKGDAREQNEEKEQFHCGLCWKTLRVCVINSRLREAYEERIACWYLLRLLSPFMAMKSD